MDMKILKTKNKIKAFVLPNTNIYYPSVVRQCDIDQR